MLCKWQWPKIARLEFLTGISCASYAESTGTIFTTTAIGMPMKPMKMLAIHCVNVRGVVFAKSPRNWIMMNWKTTVLPRTAANTLLSSMPSKTFILSISLELTSLNTCTVREKKKELMESINVLLSCFQPFLVGILWNNPILFLYKFIVPSNLSYCI